MVKVSTEMNVESNLMLTKYSSKKLLIVVNLATIILMALATVVLAIVAKDALSRTLYLVLLPLACILMCLFYPSLCKKAFIKQINSSTAIRNKLLNTFEFSEEGISVISTKGNETVGVTKISFNDVYKVVQYYEYLFIFISEMQAFIIDKRNFSCGEDDKEVMALLQKYCSSKIK